MDLRRVLAASAAAVALAGGATVAKATIIDDTPGVVYHLDAGLGVTQTGGAVSLWTDANGNGQTFTQATAAKQPTFISGASAGNINGRPVVRFDGDLTGNTGGLAPNADELILVGSTTVQTFVFVNRTLQHRNLDGPWGDEGADTGVRRASATNWQHPGNNNDFSNGGSFVVNGAATTAAALNTPHIVFATRGGTATFNDTSIGDYFQVGTNTPRSWNGDIAELAVYNRALTAAEQQAIEQFLGNRYGIAVPEPTAAGATLFGLGGLALARRRRRRA